MKIYSILWILASILVGTSANAYVSGAISASPGQWDMQLGVHAHRGLLGAEDIPETQITRPASLTEYQLSVGHHFGSGLGLKDFSSRVLFSHYLAQAELLNGSLVYAENTASKITLEFAGNFVHEPQRLFGALVRFSYAFDNLTAKFQKPRIDTYALGIQGAFEFDSIFAYEWLIYYGGGLIRDAQRVQNASLVGSALFSARLSDLIAQGLVVKLGPFFESDTTERNDPAYSLVGFRGFRVGVSLLTSVKWTSNFGTELGYVQKLSGSFFTATRDLFLNLQFAF